MPKGLIAGRVTLIATAAGLVALGPVAPASAMPISPTVFTDDMTVNGNCTLREAIVAANDDVAVDGCPAGSGEDTITLAAGTYVLTVEGDGEEDGALGDLDVTNDLQITGAGTGATVIDGAWPTDPDRILHVRVSGTDVDVTGVAVQDGDVAAGGGGILADPDTTLDLIGTQVRSNEASSGGGVFAEGAVTMTGVEVSGNFAENSGGGIFLLGPSTLSGVVLDDNDAMNSGGGGFVVGPGGTFTDVLVRGNEAGNQGGGLGFSDTVVTLRNSAFEGNSSGNNGGGIYVDAIGANTDLTLSNVTISSNDSQSQAFGGGGLSGFAFGGHTLTLSLENVTASGNRTIGDGGGIRVEQFPGGTQSFEANNVTITGNTADMDGDASGDGGGILLSAGATVLRNSIVSGNTDASATGEVHPDCSAIVTSEGHNLVQSTTGCVGVTGPGDITGQDPRLGALADNGGSTRTHALLTGSPALDAGTPSAPGSGGTSCATTDQRGFSRNGRCDMGAYELHGCRTQAVTRLGSDSGDLLTGTEALDVFLAGAGDDRVTGLGGDDVACLGSGNDSADMGAGNDTVEGEAGIDSLAGAAGIDLLLAGPGDDVLEGGDGIDVLEGGDGNDTVAGGPGDDTISTGPGNDAVDAGDGNDAVDSGDGDDATLGEDGDDTLTAGSGNDDFGGGAGNDRAAGGSGLDRLRGETGNDRLKGDAGRDRIVCGPGRKDRGKGGPGKDTLKGCERQRP